MSLNLKPLSEQVIVITGASSGIGLATGLAAVNAGARVVLAARSPQALGALRSQFGAQAITVEADVSDFAHVQAIAAAAIAQFGRIDTWVNNAGLSVYARVDEIGLGDARRLFDVNYWGVVHGSLVALPHLRQHGGALINVGSEASEATIPLQVMYSASKHAVKAFTDGLRMELEADKAPVSVTVVEPTAVDTPFPEHAGNYLSQEPKLPTPMIDPEKVASAILEVAATPKSVVRVGAMAILNTTVAKALPAVGEAMAKMQMGRQQRDEPPRTREGTLYRPGESGRVRGRGDANAADTQQAKASNTR
ncbi:MAG: SDR family NAD(P)-dependent oxidoreductase [Rubrivivax sp.]|nr:MAG: SDR family NAD(P)-dependent oxidoreductase [Rubrivivax sp.]